MLLSRSLGALRISAWSVLADEPCTTRAIFSTLASNPAIKARILDGRRMANEWLTEIGKQVRSVQEAIGRPPGLSVVLVGDRPDSLLYVSRKQEAAARVGIMYSLYHMPATARQDELDSLVDRLCHNDAVDGVLVQLPLPPHMDEERVIERFDPEKDVDGFHPLNLGRLVMRGRSNGLVPCTARGCLEMLSRAGVSVQDKNCVVLGDSNIVGLPLAMMLRDGGAASITVCHRMPNASGSLSPEAEAATRAGSNACLPVLPGPGQRIEERARRMVPSMHEPGLSGSSDVPQSQATSPASISGRGSGSGSPEGAAQAAQAAAAAAPWISSGFPSDLPNITRSADVLIVAVGSPEMVRGGWVKEGSIILDVGINAIPTNHHVPRPGGAGDAGDAGCSRGSPRGSLHEGTSNPAVSPAGTGAAAGIWGVAGTSHFTPGVSNVVQAAASVGGQEFRVVGDVNFFEVAEVAGAVSPVPGGVGPMTIAALLQNVVDACKRRKRLVA